MKVYEFKVGIWDVKTICVLAHDKKEACKIISEYREVEIDERFISNIYTIPQIVSVVDFEI